MKISKVEIPKHALNMKLLYSIFSAAFVITGSYAQTYMMPGHYQSDTITVSTGTVSDCSGSSTIGQPVSNGVLYIKPLVPGTYIRLDFSSFALGPNDRLLVLNGLSTYGTLLGSYMGNHLPPPVYSTDRSGGLTLELNCQSYFLYQGFTAAIQAITTLPPADLAFDSHTYSGYYPPYIAGGEIDLANYVYNRGGSAAYASVSYYISTDTLPDAGDSLLLTETYDTIKGGDYYFRQRPVKVPALTPGNYYLLSVIDPANSVSESDESNNRKHIPLTIAPGIHDLVFSMAMDPETVLPGGRVSVNGSLLDVGNGPAMNADIAVYLSADNIFDAADMQLGALQVHPSLTTPTYGTTFGNFVVPMSTAPGNYTVFLKADPANSISETIETNNITSFSLHVSIPRFDVNVYNASSAGVWTQGGNYSASYWINATDLPYPLNFPTSTFLSADTVIDASDLLLDTDTAYSSYYGSGAGFSGSLPMSITPGNYYVIVYADYANTIPEVNEQNNRFVLPVTIKPYEVDLLQTQPSLGNPDIAMGSSRNWYMSVYERKGGNSAAFQVACYLSADTVADASDVLLDTKTISGINGNGSAWIYDTLNFPSTILPGQYYVIAVSDYTHLISESNELNNSAYLAVTIAAPFSDLSASYCSVPYTYRDTIPRGITIQVNTSVMNSGNSSSDTTSTIILLSTDPVADAADIPVGAISTRRIDAGLTAYFSADVNFPSSIPDGDYYLIAYADHWHTLPEPDESDNYFATKIILGAGSGTIFNFSTGSHIVHTTCGEIIYDSGGNGNYHNNEHGSLTLYPGTAGSFVALDFSLMDLEACCDHLDIYDGPSTSDPMIGSFSMMPSRIVSSHTSGALTLKFISNSSGTNSGFKALATCVPYSAPDLSIESAWSGDFVLEDIANVYCRIINKGTSTAAATYTGFYLSTDTVYGSGDIFLGNDLFTYVLPGTTSYEDVSLNIPSSVTPGNYYLLIRTDNTGIVAEHDESNNVFNYPVVIHAPLTDIVCSNLSINYGYYSSTSNFFPGGPLELTAAIVNKFYKRIDTSVVRYYFSTDTVLDVWDVPAGYSYTGSVNPTRYFTHNDTITIPSSLTPGHYFLLLKADALNMFAETDESNNIAFEPVELLPATMDIGFGNSYLNNYTLAAGALIRLNYYVQDLGNIPFPRTAPVSNGFYLSADTVPSPSDPLLGGSVNTVPTYTSQYLTIPAGLSPGSYQVILRTDTLNAFAESDEANNLYRIPVELFPANVDLTTDGLYTNTTAIIENSWLSIHFLLRNRGFGSTPSPALIHYYFSGDTVLDASDTLLYAFPYSTLGGNSCTLMSINKLLPAGITGNNYIIVQLDPSNTITETDETNNTFVLPITIAPKSSDLHIGSPVTGTTALAPGAVTTVKSIFELYGNVNLNNQVTGYFLSTDTVLDWSDVYLSSTTTPWVYHWPYTPVTVNGTITIPAGTSYGSYYLLYSADPNNITPESNELNNVSYSPVTVTAPTNDLRVSALRTAGTAVAAGSSIDATPLSFNAGTTGTASYKIGFYLSTDSVYDSSDLYLQQQLMNPLNPGVRDSATSVITIPVSMPAGDYYLVAYADFTHMVTESSESNNYMSCRISIVEGFNDVTMRSISSSGYVTSGSGLTLYYNVQNICNLYQFNVKTALYFSTDTVPGPSDVVLGVSNIAVLTPGQYYNGNLSFSLPPGTPYGSYYIIAKTDYPDYITEPDEINNIRYQSLNYNSGSNNITDLIITDLAANDTMHENVTETVKSILRASSAGCSSGKVGYFLSSDWMLDNIDLPLAAVDSGAMTSYGMKTVMADVLLPTWITPGIYYLIAAADYKNLVNENNENNNTGVKPVYVSDVTGIAEHAENFSLILYPNPSSGNISFKGHFAEEEWGQELQVEIINMAGATVYSDTFRNEIDVEKSIPVSGTNNGIYFLKISGKQKSTSGKYVKVN
jgi:subtilase family serine protease